MGMQSTQGHGKIVSVTVWYAAPHMMLHGATALIGPQRGLLFRYPIKRVYGGETFAPISCLRCKSLAASAELELVCGGGRQMS